MTSAEASGLMSISLLGRPRQGVRVGSGPSIAQDQAGDQGVHGRDTLTRGRGFAPSANRGAPSCPSRPKQQPSVRSRSRFRRSSSLSCAAGSRRRAGLPKELVADRSQGVQLATLQALARYWTTDYDWRKCEARLNALPQFTTEIDGVDIHFIHVRSRHENALPLIMTHGWPGSVIELLETVGPLTDPTAHGGTAEDAFHLVLPSLPGYGFSSEPAELGWDAARIARAWAELMHRLGYTALRRPGRRRGCPRHGPDGSPGGRGFGRLPPEPAHGGARNRRSPAQGIRTGTRSGRGGRGVQGRRLRLLPRDGNAAADDRLLPAGFARRAGGLDARPRHRQLLQDLPRVRRRRARRAISPATPSSTTSRCTG